MLGVFFTIKYGYFQNLHVLFLSSFVLFIGFFLIQKLVNSNNKFKQWLYIMSTHTLLFFLANESCYFYNAKNHSNHYTHYIEQTTQRFIGIVDDLPVVTEKFTKLSVQLNVIESSNSWHVTTGKDRKSVV